MGIHHFLDRDQGEVCLSHGQSEKSETQSWSRQQDATDSGSACETCYTVAAKFRQKHRKNNLQRRDCESSTPGMPETSIEEWNKNLASFPQLPRGLLKRKDWSVGKVPEVVNARNTHVQLTQATYPSP